MKWSLSEYKESTFLAREAGCELISRLPLLTIQPQTIAVLGQGFSEISEKLQSWYPLAKLVFVADSVAEFGEATQHRFIADAIHLPLKSDSIDLLIANFCLPWVQEPGKLLPEWRRVVKVDGVVLFNALGLDTVQEYQSAWHEAIIPGFSDLHNLGDSFTQAGFLDPVLDSNYYHINYRDAKKMLRELYVSGMLALTDEADRDERLTEANTLRLTFEIIQGHAFAPAKQVAQAKHGVAKIPLADLKDSLRRKS